MVPERPCYRRPGDPVRFTYLATGLSRPELRQPCEHRHPAAALVVSNEPNRPFHRRFAPTTPSNQNEQTNPRFETPVRGSRSQKMRHPHSINPRNHNKPNILTTQMKSVRLSH